MRYLTISGLLFLLIIGVHFSFITKDSPAGGIITISNEGKQPTLTVDRNNIIKAVFGKDKQEIYYTYSKDEGKTFSTPQLIARQPKLALGMTRGPQIITTKDYTIVAAAAHTGKIMVYRLKNNATKWSEPVNILKTDTTAKEGFIALAPGKDNAVYAAWLDMRLGMNNIFGAYSTDGGKTWSASKLIYKSPEGRVCPCCRLSMAADQKGNVYVMFRNELAGNRDMYLAQSKDGGKTYGPAQKLGMGTWNLKGCPMDGGAVSMNTRGEVGTNWRRDNTIYYAEPGKMEQKIGEGRASTFIKADKGNYFAWQQGNNIMVLTPNSLTPEIIGSGIYPRLTLLPDQKVLSVWEKDGKILAKML